jgi:hypothetical protein
VAAFLDELLTAFFSPTLLADEAALEMTLEQSLRNFCGGG